MPNGTNRVGLGVGVLRREAAFYTNCVLVQDRFWLGSGLGLFAVHGSTVCITTFGYLYSGLRGGRYGDRAVNID